MCGVFAAQLDKGRLSRQQVGSAVRQLAHRGPDGEGIWLSEDRRVALGHRRLSIVGIDNGDQPIANEDRTVRVSVNGEFYGFETIRRDLRRRGHDFRTETDSEIVLHLYEEYGLDCLRFLRGEFAFVLWDAHNSHIFAARDRFGVKPLCYAQGSQGIYLASEAKALFALGLPSSWDHESLFHATSMQYLLPDRTLFSGVRQIPPGHFLLARANEISVQSYWELQFPELAAMESTAEAATPRSRQRLVDECRYRVVDSIRSRLRSEVPVCCHLSGGLDSGTVLCIASALSSHPLDAFVISFEVDDYDELNAAQKTARSCEANLHEVRVSQVDLLEHLQAAVVASEGLAINGHLPAKFLLHRAINQRGFKVVLTGEGADEMFAGYAHLCLDLWRSLGSTGQERRLVDSNRTSQGMMLPHGPSLSLSGVRARLGFVPAYLEAKATLGRRVQSLLRDDVLNEFHGRDAFGELIDRTGAGEHLRDRHPVHQSTWLWSRTALAGYILRTLGDGTEMPSSVEGRVPFLDHSLVEFLNKVPMAFKIRGTTEKFLLREAVRCFVPEAIYRRQKHPLDAPPLSLFGSSQTQEILNCRLRDASFERQPYFCPNKCTRLLDQLHLLDRQERQAWDPALMMALSTIGIQQILDGHLQCMN